MVDISIGLLYLYFFSDSISQLKIIQFFVGLIFFTVYFYYKITTFFLTSISYLYKFLKFFIFILVPVIPFLFQAALIFHFFFDYLWNLYLHVVINSYIFIFFPYYSYLFYNFSINQDNIVSSLIKNYSKNLIKMLILIGVAYFSHFYMWYESVIYLILVDIYCNYRFKKK